MTDYVIVKRSKMGDVWLHEFDWITPGTVTDVRDATRFTTMMSAVNALEALPLFWGTGWKIEEVSP